MSLLIDGDLVSGLGWALLHSLWQGTVVAIVFAAAMALISKRAARLRYGVGCMALLAMVALSLQTFARELDRRSALSMTASASQGGMADPSTSRVVIGAASGRLAAVGARWREALEAALPWIVGGWLVGVGLSTLRLGAGFVKLRRPRRAAVSASARLRQRLEELACRMGIRREVTLLECRSCTVPLTIGWLRPFILLPPSILLRISPEHLESILLHELAHIRRLDYLVNVLQSVIDAVFFYHPAVWFISRRVRVEREHCCDDLAAATAGSPRRYALALTTLEEISAGEQGQLGLAVSGRSLRGRVERLLPARRRVPPPRTSALVAVVLIALVAVTTIGSGLLAAPQQPSAAGSSAELAQVVLYLQIVQADRFLAADLGADLKRPRSGPRLVTGSTQSHDLDSLVAALASAHQEGRARVLSAPRIVTLENQSASVRTALRDSIDGDRREVSSLEIGVTPRRETPEVLHLEVALSWRSPPPDAAHSADAPFSRLVQAAALSLRLRPGEIAVIGGLELPDERNPEELEELLVFVTAEVVETSPPVVPVSEPLPPNDDGFYRSQPISMSLKNADLREVLDASARISQRDVEVAPDIAGTVTIELNDVPWDQALDQLLERHGLQLTEEGDKHVIARREGTGIPR